MCSRRPAGWFIVRSGKIDDRLGEHTAHSGFLRHARDGVFKIVHVAIGGCSAAHHFEKTQPRGPDDEIFGDVARFGWKNVFLEPFVERKIVGNATEQAHRRVGVAIDQARHDDGAMRVDYFWRFVLRFDFGRFSDRDNGIAASCDCAILDDAMLRVHRDDGAVEDEKVRFILCEAWRREQGDENPDPHTRTRIKTSLSGRDQSAKWALRIVR